MFLHIDLDAFFASVEQLDNPKLKGKPVIVGALPGSSRGVVSTCSYEARKYGVHSAMPIEQAYKLCKDGIFLPCRMQRYHEKSYEVMKIFNDFSPDVQQMSVDEAFVDLTGTERLFGPIVSTAKKIKERVFNETGLTVSVGIGTNKYIAKIASGLSKPDGLFLVPEGTEEAFISTLPLTKIWGIGKKTLEKLNKLGFYSVNDIKKNPLNILESYFGKSGAMFLYKAVRGLNAETFSSTTSSKSISAENTYENDLIDRYIIETSILSLTETVMFRLLKENWKSKTVFLKIRYDDFSTISVQSTSSKYITSVDDLFDRVCNLFYKKYNGGRIRLLGVGAMNLESADKAVQIELFDTIDDKKQKVEDALISIKTKHPNIKITKARLLNKE